MHPSIRPAFHNVVQGLSGRWDFGLRDSRRFVTKPRRFFKRRPGLGLQSAQTGCCASSILPSRATKRMSFWPTVPSISQHAHRPSVRRSPSCDMVLVCCMCPRDVQSVQSEPLSPKLQRLNHVQHLTICVYIYSHIYTIHICRC